MSLTANNNVKTASDSIMVDVQFIYLPIESPPPYIKFTIKEEILLEDNVNTNSLYCWCVDTHLNIAQ